MSETKIINQFYTAFKNLDAEAMVTCYHDEVTFEDPAFGKLHGENAKNMWRMLCKSQQGKDFKINFSSIQFENNIGTANWEAFYTFSKTGRKVHNKIKANFLFQDGKIIKHTDSFSLHAWASQALGIKGFALGWLPFFKSKFQVQTNKLLQKFEADL
ncbi:nuclear transport factor 2 family protein [Paucihalobacter ruber]|uniref:Nuclear transport factor 2 family protein n=1 Tax=Paucihalobacter ruber TaxID=2567861 RepID=A0A506PD82_9FLAO|nr:nuclear transport factor 2 family protein [Paucihalobacter ruber]TPV31539.1 nuclear transport factor 2 family protein [Paucihalobacter ruber]